VIVKSQELRIYDQDRLWPDYKRRLHRVILKQMPQVEEAMKFILGTSDQYERSLFTVEISLLLSTESDERIRINRLMVPPMLEPSEAWNVTVSGSYSDGIEGLVKYEFCVSLPNLTCWIE